MFLVRPRPRFAGGATGSSEASRLPAFLPSLVLLVPSSPPALLAAALSFAAVWYQFLAAAVAFW